MGGSKALDPPASYNSEGFLGWASCHRFFLCSQEPCLAVCWCPFPLCRCAGTMPTSLCGCGVFVGSSEQAKREHLRSTNKWVKAKKSQRPLNFPKVTPGQSTETSAASSSSRSRSSNSSAQSTSAAPSATSAQSGSSAQSNSAAQSATSAQSNSAAQSGGSEQSNSAAQGNSPAQSSSPAEGASQPQASIYLQKMLPTELLEGRGGLVVVNKIALDVFTLVFEKQNPQS